MTNGQQHKYNRVMTTLTDKFYSIINEQSAAQFQTYFDMLIDYNTRFNLTAITQREQVYIKHFADSIAAVDIVSGNVLDIGAGAGFPSLPLKIVKPSLNVTMADSLNKRVGFLRDVIAALKLENIQAIHTRAEDIKKDVLYDCAIARAVAPLNTLCEYMLPFIKEGGHMIAYKAKDCVQEVQQAKNAITLLGGGRPQIKEFMLDYETPRTLVIIEKIKNTPAKYPRSGNKPKVSPL